VAVRDALAAAGVPRLVVALVPDKSRVYADRLDGTGRRPAYAWRYHTFRAALVNAGIAAPDLLKPLMDASGTTRTFMRTDTHWTPAGAEIAAEEVAAAVRALRVPPPSLDAAAFVTSDAPAVAHDGDLLRFIPLGALRPWLWGPLERLTPRTTAARADANGGDADALLFGEQTIPAVLVGTSFSAMSEWNFDGALKQALGMDVLNLADKGHGPMAPMDAYLASGTLRESPPELVIWEIPERYLPVAYDAPGGSTVSVSASR